MAKRVEHKNKKTAEGAIAPRKATASSKKRTVPRPGREKFLPVSRADMDARGWDACDFVYICGDAYVDHSSFGMAIISRILEAHGYRVGIICQPDWNDPKSISILGEPRLGFLVSAGNMDSMVNHYSVTKHRRHTDAYTPGGEAGRRPNRAVTVYGNLIRRTYKKAPIIIGGIEASLRRLAHSDYWQDKLKRSVLLDSGADLLIYGMGEHAIIEIADASTPVCPSIKSHMSTAQSIAQAEKARSMPCTITSCSQAGMSSTATGSPTPRALTSSSKTWTLSRGNAW